MEEVILILDNNLQFNAIIISRSFNNDIQRRGNFTFSGRNRRSSVTLQFTDNVPAIDDLINITINIQRENGNTMMSFNPESIVVDDVNSNIMTFIFN